jgi:hypothetical protein
LASTPAPAATILAPDIMSGRRHAWHGINDIECARVAAGSSKAKVVYVADVEAVGLQFQTG